MKRIMYTKKMLLRAVITLMMAFAAGESAWAQYVAIFADPYSGGMVQVGTEPELDPFSDGASFVMADAGETVYFSYEPFSDYRFRGIRYTNLSSDDVTELSDGIYSFTMPEYSGDEEFWVYIFIELEKIPVVVTGVDINADNFPDDNFRNWLLAQDYGKDAIITDAEMAGITRISAPDCGIEDLTGIEFFTELTELYVYNHEETAEEDRNKITSINLAATTKLRILFCGFNQISSLDLSPCLQLRNLDCGNNLLTQLDVTNNPLLSSLSCNNNQLTGIDVSQNTLLSVFSCSNNQITELDVYDNMGLNQFFCDNNLLTTIDVTNHDNLHIFNCNNNLLTTLDLTGCDVMYQFYFYNNQISGQAMTDLVNSLPTPPYGGYMVVVDLDSEIEQNDITEEQAAVAREKTWSVEAIENDDFIRYPKSNTHDYVDLGLPSGTLWATCNVGANNPHNAGLYFAWGDTTGYGNDTSDGHFFDWENYKWGFVDGEETDFTKYCSDSSRGKDGFTDGKTVLDSEDDAAFVNWGSEWRTPTYAQWVELKNECEWTAATVFGVNGYEVTGPNGNSIFLPETGWRIDDMLLEGGAYWSRTTNPEDVGGAYYLGFDEWGWYIYGGRSDGQCVRPVKRMGPVTVTIPASGIASFSADENITIPEGITAHYCTDYDGADNIIQVEKLTQNTIPAATGVLIKGTAGETYTLSVTDDDTETVTDNALVAVTVPTHVEQIDGDYTNFMLKSGKFIKIAQADASSKMPANKAYLRLLTSLLADDSDANGIFLEWDETTGLRTVTAQEAEGNDIYDLQGRRVNTPVKGQVYIINRKKVMK